MSRIPGLDSRRGCSVLGVIGWAIAVLLGVVLVWLGFLRPALQRREAAQGTATPQISPTSAIEVQPTLPPPTAAPSPTPLPSTPTPLPTPPPPPPTPVVASMVAGADGVNVRTGPGTSFTKIGYIDPGGSARLIGRYNDWWQIDYNGTPGWVFGELVTASNAENVPQVQPPPSPTPPPPPPATNTPVPTNTAAPPTPTTAPGAAHGIQVNGFSIEGAPGPFNKSSSTKSCSDDDGGRIWYNMDLTVVSAVEVPFTIVGAWVKETGFHKPSYTNSDWNPGEHFVWRDCLRIPEGGNYNIYLRICYASDGVCENLAGPIGVQIRP